MPTSIVKFTHGATSAQVAEIFGRIAVDKREGAAAVARYLEALAAGTTQYPASVQCTNSEASGVAASMTVTFASTGPANTQTGSIGGKTLTAKTSGAVAANGEFNVSATPATVAANFLAAVNAYIPGVVATRSGAVVTITARDKGVPGNLITSLVGTLANTTFSGTALSGGVDPVYVTWDFT